jgi:hypothetical protein
MSYCLAARKAHLAVRAVTGYWSLPLRQSEGTPLAHRIAASYCNSRLLNDSMSDAAIMAFLRHSVLAQLMIEPLQQ